MSNRQRKNNGAKAKADAAASAIAASAPLDVLPITWPELQPNGRPVKGSMMNALAAIYALRLDCRLDVFHQAYIINGTNLGRYVGEVSDKVTRKIRELSFCAFGHDPGKEATYEAIQRACEEHQFHPILDYLDGLIWDGKPRLDTWLSRYLGAEDTPLHRAWGKLVLIAAVRRIRKPGTKFDHVLVLEGPEGKLKSSTVQTLASGKPGGMENFSDSAILHVEEKKQMELTAGVWFYELGEMAGIRRAEVTALKAFVTRQEERARPAYGRFQEKQPRTCIFIGSYNTTDDSEIIEYLNVGDHRRWWPLLVGDIDIEALERDRDQLFAETAFAEEFDGISLALPEHLWSAAKVVQQAREMTDTIADRLSTLFDDVLTGWKGGSRSAGALVTDSCVWVSSKYVLDALPPGEARDSKRITGAMRKEGWRAVRDRRTGGEQLRGYEKKREQENETR